MWQIVLLIHAILAVALIALVLLQHGKGADMGAAFGSGASQTIFGSQGSGSFLSKVTLTLAGCFFVTSLVLGYIATKEYKHNQQTVLPFVPGSAQTALPPAPPATVPVVPASTGSKK